MFAQIDAEVSGDLLSLQQVMVNNGANQWGVGFV
jgi:hypothetical protein